MLFGKMCWSHPRHTFHPNLRYSPGISPCPLCHPPTTSEIPLRNWTLTPTLPNLSALCICPVLLCGSVLVLITIIAQIIFSSTFSHIPIYYHDTSVVVTVFGTSCLALVGYYKAQIPEPKFPIDVSLHITGQ